MAEETHINHLALIGTAVKLSGADECLVLDMSITDLAEYLTRLNNSSRSCKPAEIMSTIDTKKLAEMINDLAEDGLTGTGIAQAATSAAGFDWHPQHDAETIKDYPACLYVLHYLLRHIAYRLSKTDKKIDELEDEVMSAEERAEEAEKLAEKWESIATSFQKANDQLTDYLNALKLKVQKL